MQNCSNNGSKGLDPLIVLIMRMVSPWVLIVSLSVLVMACTQPETTSPPTATPTPAATPRPTPTSEPKPTSTPIPQLTLTPSPTPTSTPEPTDTPTAPITIPAPTATAIPVADPSVSSPTKEPIQPQEDCTRKSDIGLTYFYTDLDQIEMINPTIVTSGNWLKNRQYHKILTDTNNAASQVPLYAPADAVAIELTHYVATMRPWNRPPYDASQFDVRFQVSCDVFFWFDHITKLAEPFASLSPDEGVRDTRNAAVSIRVEVAAGDLIGWTSGTDPAHVWDFVMVDKRKTTLFANQERYEKTGDLQNLLHTACPYDYYGESMRSVYISKFAWWGGSVDSTSCGGPVDVPGTLAGGWFLTPFDANKPFAPADWGLVAKIEADGLAYIAGPGWEVRSSPQDPSFADPITVTTEHCYENRRQPARWAYVKLLSDTELAAAHGEGTCPTSLPAEHRIYYR